MAPASEPLRSTDWLPLAAWSRLPTRSTEPDSTVQPPNVWLAVYVTAPEPASGASKSPLVRTPWTDRAAPRGSLVGAMVGVSLAVGLGEAVGPVVGVRPG